MNRFKLHIVALLLCISTVAVAQSNSISVEARIDSISLFIGEQATLTIAADQPRSARLQFPIFSDVITGKLELVETLTPDTTDISSDMIHVENRYTVTAFDSAMIYMPGFEVIAGNDTLLTNSLALKILDMPVDTAQQAITDIKGVYDPPFDWIRLFSIIGICLLFAILIAAIVLLIIKLNRRKVSEDAAPVVDPRSAYEIAMTDLQTLQDKKLWQAGHNKEYQSELTDIVKQYISRRFAVNAVEQSTEDLLFTFRSDKSLRELKTEISLLTSILQLADFVKFAKMLPLPADNERSMKDAIQFVELTKQQEQPKESPSDTDNSSAANPLNN